MAFVPLHPRLPRGEKMGWTGQKAVLGVLRGKSMVIPVLRDPLV